MKTKLQIVFISLLVALGGFLFGFDAGFISGVIYYKNHGHPTIFDDLGGSYDGIDGTMLLFPSSTIHGVEEQIVDEERITFAFNIFRDSDHDLLN